MRTRLFRRLMAERRARRIFSRRPEEDQTRLLFDLLKRAERTRLGREAGFKRISALEEYQRALPLRQYEDFWNSYWKDSFPRVKDATWPGTYRYFAVTSGTTSGGTKYIPFTKEMMRANKEAALDLLSLHVVEKRDSALMDGKLFFLGGSSELVQEAPGIYSGDLSGIVSAESPFYVDPFYFPGRQDALIADWDKKLSRFAERAVHEDIRLFSGVPAWMLLLMDKMEEISGKRMPGIWPNFELLIHGGVKFDPYREIFEERLRRKDGSLPNFLEVYPASEGFFGFSEPGRRDMRLLTNHNVFYEFVPLDDLESENPSARTVENVEENVPYAVVITTGAGLWRYVVGDVLRFTEARDSAGNLTLRFVFAGRTKQGISAFGEHLIGEEVDSALASACEAAGARLRDYTMTVYFPKSEKELGGHELAVEFITPPSDLALFEKKFDEALCKENDDFKAHCSEGFGLNPPRVVAVPEGTFEAWMRSRGKLGGQNKVPRLSASREYFEGVLSLSKTRK